MADAFDTNGDSKLSASEISAATRINVSDYNVSSLKGIEFLTSLEELNCAYGELTELNVSKNNELTELDCTFNNLTVFINDNELGSIGDHFMRKLCSFEI